MQNTSSTQKVQLNSEQNEPNLRDLLESLWNGKFIIIVVTIFAILLGIGYSIFMTSDIYESTAVVMTTPVDLSPENSSDSSVIDYLAQYPVLTTETYLYQVKDPSVLLATIQSLSLKHEDGTYWTVNQLAGMVVASNISNTNLISIKVRYNDAKTATEIANEISYQFSSFISNSSRRQGMQTADIILEQLEVEENNMQDKSAQLTNYLQEYGSVDLLKNEVEALVNQVTGITTTLNRIDAEIEADTANLSSLLSSQDIEAPIDFGQYSIILDQSQNTEDRIRQLQLNLNTNELTSTMMQFTIVDVQTRLLENLTSRDALYGQKDELSDKLQELQIRMNEEEYRFNALQRDFDLSRQAYAAYQSMYQQALQTAAADIGATSVTIASEAIVPVSPVAPNRVLIVTASGVMGFVIGVFLAFFAAYWKKSQPQKR